MNSTTRKRITETKEPIAKDTENKRSKPRSAKPAAATPADEEVNDEIHLVCKQETLNEALTFVKTAVPNRTNQPVLTNVLIAANTTQQRITLTTSDLTLTLTASFSAEVIAGGEITVPADILAEIISKCPSGNLILTTQATTSLMAGKPIAHHQAQVVDEQNGITHLRGMSASEFPSTPSIKAARIELPAKVIKAGVQGAMFAICNDEEKRILTGLNWVLHPIQKTLHCTATDGHQVAIVRLDLGGIGKKRRQAKQTAEEIRCTIPMKALKELTRTLEKCKLDTPLQFASEDNRVIFEVTENGITRQLLCQCLEGDYPDCQALLSRYQYPRQVTLDKYDLLARLDRLAVLADKKEHAVRLKFDRATQSVTLSIERDYGKGQQQMPAMLPDEMNDLEILFNVTYLLNAIKALGSSALKLVMNQPDTPANICSAGELEMPELNMEATYFVMPLSSREQASRMAKDSTRTTTADAEAN